MSSSTQPRAPRNRTLTVSDDEQAHLDSLLDTPAIIRAHYHDDSIVCGDLLEVIDLIPDGHFPLIIVDPPYNLTKDFHGQKFMSRSDGDYETYLRSWLGKVCQKLTSDGTLYLCGDWRCTAPMQRVLSEHLTLLNRITWQREKGRGAQRNWKNAMEDIWFAVKDPARYTFNVEAVKMCRRVIAPYKVDGQPKDWEATAQGNFRLTYPSNFWDDISIPFWSMPENTDHPTQKPEKLIAKLILASSNPDDTVFDPFLGSGTTAVVAAKLGRHYCGVECNPTYCRLAAKRLEHAQTDHTIQGYADGVFWERNTTPPSLKNLSL